ncbi:Fanconi anemia group M protein [Apis dorsata]|uniref:Fanconi anemia group M protein n=1 Tax=Apis dorsata TaxID=7462 RepID=UPI0012935B77|nr:Fanconi anemia group M protein [Apis dorsata]
MELSQNPQISFDERTKGFDLSAGKTWIYPENYPVRDYQFNIVQACLYRNTLVCLPTGLGKTFIAAVVMYNFWRWYPWGKIIFLAPTKPLVAQQIFACHDIMGIPSAETIELTGAISLKKREIAWSKKRIIFATPQVFHNDLNKNIVPSDLIKCVVIDEAHKALGKHSYCECIHILSGKNQNFRVLALSATPGNKIDNVHEVLQNLLIAHVELRDETSLDIVPYINKKKFEIILVPLNNKLIEYKEKYIFIMDRHVKILLQYNILRGQTANISKGRVFHLLKEFQKKTNKTGNYGQIIKTLNILMTMYHAYELMIRDGLRAFYKFYQSHSDKFWMNEEPQLQILLEDIKTYLGPFPDTKILCQETIMEIPQNLIFGHTKFDKLKELLIYHFKNNQKKENNTRAIVFVEYRDIVSEIYILLLQCQPLIRPQMFVGQAGQKQKQQIKALENFKNNYVNVLISTSIGEEGLDVGEVDLIICFDVSQHSPTRLVQRMGRTGRKRDGHIIILVTDGKEHETLKSTIARRDSLNYKVLNTNNIFSSLYQNNPRMIPDILIPECLKMHISIQPKTPVIKYKNRKREANNKEKKHQNIIKKNEFNLVSKKNETKFLMMKYLKVEENKESSKYNYGILNFETIQNINNHNTTKLSDVKILSCDNHAVDFLTICALKISAREENIKNKCKINKSYVPKSSFVKNFVDFTIPDIKVLDCLITLNDIIPYNYNKNKSNNDNKNDNWNNSHNDEYIVKNKITLTEIVDKYQQKSSSKFEDLLDDSNKSNETDLSDNEEKKLENSIMYSIYPSSSVSKQCIQSNLLESVRTGNTNIILQNSISDKFEDILNEISDDSETNYTENFEQNLIKNIDIKNNEQIKNSSNITELDNNFRLKNDLQKEIKINNFSSIPMDQYKHNFEYFEDLSETTNMPKFIEFQNEYTFNEKQTIDEIVRLNSNSILSKINESEDDIFQDKNFLLQIDNQSNFDEQINNSIDYKDEKNFNKIENLNNQKNIINTELEVEEYDWDDDFKVSIDTVQNYIKFDTFEEKQNNEKLKIENNMEKCDLNNKEWISIEKSKNISKQNASRMTIANKLANVRKRNSNYNYFNNDSMNKDNSKNVHLSTVKEKKYISFIDKSKNKKKHVNQKKETEYSRKHNRNRKLRKTKNEFILEEAEVSSNSETTNESCETDDDLKDFVSYTQNIQDTSDIYVHYLQSTRSPVNRQNFLFKQQYTLNSNIDIYSQPITQNESYINDSFCVTGDEIDKEITRDKELSELEKAEKKLKRQKRKRISNKELSRYRRINKRRNIINYFSTSEDETENLRKQIKDESLLKRS